MRSVRTAATLLGVVILGLAVGAVLDPELAGRLDVAAAFGNDYLFVVPLGVGATVVLMGSLASRTIRGVDQARPPDPERVPTADAPGSEFDRLVGGGWRTAPAAIRRREALHDRLRAVAIRTLVSETGCTRTEARRRVETGTWTEDHEAAAFLVEDPDGGRQSAADVVGAVLRLELPLQRRARRAAEAVARLHGGGRA